MRAVAGAGEVALAIAVLTTSLAALACAAHDDDLARPGSSVAAPTLVHEPEPAPALPAVVAPALPELEPTRPLANLALVWHTPDGEGPPASTVWAVGRAPVAMEASEAGALGLAGPPVDVSTLTTEASWPVTYAGPLLILSTGARYAALERGTNEVRWSTQDLPDVRSYGLFVSPRVLVAQLYVSDADRLVAWALDGGRQVWERQGSKDGEFFRIKTLSIDGSRGYFMSQSALFAFDPDIGATLWTATLASSDCGVVARDGAVVIEDPAGHRLLDAELGRELGRFPAMGARDCQWESYSYDGIAPGVIAEGRLYAFDSTTTTDTSPLRAFDIATRRELWTVEGVGDDLLVADHDAVFVARDDETLIALDAATGKAQVEFSVGGPFSVRVEPVGGAAGPLVVIEDETTYQWILGRGETPVPPESFEISGTLVPAQGMPKRRVAGVRVRVGSQAVKTDKQGRFRARGSGRGSVVVERAAFWDEYDYDPDEWTQVVVDPQRVTLDGAGSYDLGEIPAYEVSLE